MTENVAREFAEKSADASRTRTEKYRPPPRKPRRPWSSTYSTASKGAADFNLHLLEIAQENMNAAFDFARQLTRVKSPSEFFELSAAHTRKQFETFTEQTKHLASLAQKVTTDAAQPLQTGVAKVFNKSA